ncbi:hypothetical protein K1719_040183 [Acacia pycnantha]|nr:hypothetical protein K1719_040183 [Acacia pycnantha]
MLYIGEKGKNLIVLITDHESGGSLVTMILILTMFPKRKASYEAGRDMVNESAAKVRDMLARRDSLLEEESAKHQQVMEIQNRLSQKQAELSELGEQLCKLEKAEYSRLFAAWDEAEKADEMHAAGQASLDSARAKWNDLKFKLD